MLIRHSAISCQEQEQEKSQTPGWKGVFHSPDSLASSIQAQPSQKPKSGLHSQNRLRTVDLVQKRKAAA